MLDLAGVVLGSFDVEGASAVDWEDVARGPCRAVSCLFFADIGDNDEVRSSYTIYRVPEPEVLGEGRAVTADALPFQYPDGSHNAEAVLVDPLSGVVTIVTKVGSGPAPIYELPMPLTPGTVVQALPAGFVAVPEGSEPITGGDVHPAGHGVLVRTYDRLLHYAKAPDQSVAAALAARPCEVPVADEMQGEAVAWLADGSGYVTMSEGEAEELHVVTCAP